MVCLICCACSISKGIPDDKGLLRGIIRLSVNAGFRDCISHKDTNPQHYMTERLLFKDTDGINGMCFNDTNGIIEETRVKIAAGYIADKYECDIIILQEK